MSNKIRKLIKESNKLIAKMQAEGKISYDVVYCPVADQIGIVDYNFQDVSMIKFYTNKHKFRLTAFPVILGEL